MYAALKGKLGGLEHLIAKGANLNAQNAVVRRGPAATWRRGAWGKGVSGGRLRAVASLPRGLAVPG